MEMNLIEGGIYRFGANPNNAGLIVVIYKNKTELIIFTINDFLSYEINSNKEVIEKLNRLIDHNAELSIGFRHFEDLKLENLIHGYLGKVSNEIIDILVNKADQMYGLNGFGRTKYSTILNKF